LSQISWSELGFAGKWLPLWNLKRKALMMTIDDMMDKYDMMMK